MDTGGEASPSSPPSGDWGGGPPPSLPLLAARLGGPVAFRSWNAASLFGSDPPDVQWRWCGTVARSSSPPAWRRMPTLSSTKRLEAHGRIGLAKGVPGWAFWGSFPDNGDYGGILFAVLPRLQNLSKDTSLCEVVKSRVGVLTLRSAAGAPHLSTLLTSTLPATGAQRRKPRSVSYAGVSACVERQPHCFWAALTSCCPRKADTRSRVA